MKIAEKQIARIKVTDLDGNTLADISKNGLFEADNIIVHLFEEVEHEL